MADSLSADERTVYELLKQHRGRDDPISSGALADAIGMDVANGHPQIRQLVKRVERKSGLPIGSCNQGYFWIQTMAEFREHAAGIRQRIEGMQTGLAITERNIEAQLAGDTPDDIRGQVSLDEL